MDKDLVIKTFLDTVEKYQEKIKVKCNLLLYIKDEKTVTVRILDENANYYIENDSVDLTLKNAIGFGKYALAGASGYNLDRVMAEKLSKLKEENEMPNIVAIFNTDILEREKFYIQCDEPKKVKIINFNDIL